MQTEALVRLRLLSMGSSLCCKMGREVGCAVSKTNLHNIFFSGNEIHKLYNVFLFIL